MVEHMMKLYVLDMSYITSVQQSFTIIANFQYHEKVTKYNQESSKPLSALFKAFVGTLSAHVKAFVGTLDNMQLVPQCS